MAKKKVTRKYLEQSEVTDLLRRMIETGFINAESMAPKDVKRIIRGFKSARTKLALSHVLKRIHARINGESVWTSNRMIRLVDQAIAGLPKTLRNKIKVANMSDAKYLKAKRMAQEKHKESKMGKKRKKRKKQKISAKARKWVNSKQNLENLVKARAARKDKPKAKIPTITEAKAAIAKLQKSGVSAERFAALEKEVKDTTKKVSVIYKALGL